MTIWTDDLAHFAHKKINLRARQRSHLVKGADKRRGSRQLGRVGAALAQRALGATLGTRLVRLGRRKVGGVDEGKVVVGELGRRGQSVQGRRRRHGLPGATRHGRAGTGPASRGRRAGTGAKRHGGASARHAAHRAGVGTRTGSTRARTAGAARTARATGAALAAGTTREAGARGRRRHGTATNRLGIRHDELVGVGVKVGSVAVVISSVVVGSRQRRVRALGIVKVLLVEGPDTVGSRLRILRLGHFGGGQRAVANRQALGVLVRNHQSLTNTRASAVIGLLVLLGLGRGNHRGVVKVGVVLSVLNDSLDALVAWSSVDFLCGSSGLRAVQQTKTNSATHLRVHPQVQLSGLALARVVDGEIGRLVLLLLGLNTLLSHGSRLANLRNGWHRRKVGLRRWHGSVLRDGLLLNHGWYWDIRLHCGHRRRSAGREGRLGVRVLSQRLVGVGVGLAGLALRGGCHHRGRVAATGLVKGTDGASLAHVGRHGAVRVVGLVQGLGERAHGLSGALDVVGEKVRAGQVHVHGQAARMLGLLATEPQLAPALGAGSTARVAQAKVKRLVLRVDVLQLLPLHVAPVEVEQGADKDQSKRDPVWKKERRVRNQKRCRCQKET